MDLINHFNEKEWAKGDAKNTKGFMSYRIAKLNKAEEDRFEYAIYDCEGEAHHVTIYGGNPWGENDPLWGIGQALLKLDDEKKKITGIILEDDCVVRKRK